MPGVEPLGLPAGGVGGGAARTDPLVRRRRRQFDVHFKRRIVAAPLEAHFNLLLVDLHILGDHRQQFTLEDRQVIGARPGGPLMRQHDLEAFLGLLGDGFAGSLPEEVEDAHAVLRRRRSRKPFFSGFMKRCSTVSPRNRATASV